MAAQAPVTHGTEAADTPAAGGPRGLADVVQAGRRLIDRPLAPRIALCLLVAFSLAAKSIDLYQPRCEAPCSASKDTLIFDESYYVNAARVIAGIEPPAKSPYHGTPRGDDPNAEHPQLAKLVIAAGIEVFGDNPLGWRIGSILFSLIALLALYALVRACGGGPWLAVGASAVMALDNLMLVHGRIGTLDVYAVAMMILAATFYMRRAPLLAGLTLAVAACMKEVALSLALVFVLMEALQIARRRLGQGDPLPAVVGVGRPAAAPATARPAPDQAMAVDASRADDDRSPVTPRRRLFDAEATARCRRLGLFLLTGAIGTLGLLWLLDVLVPAYDPGTHVLYAGNPFSHLSHMYNYAQLLKTKAGETGIASDPLAWLLDEKPINYARVAVNTSVAGKVVATHDTIRFEGVINPFIIFLTIPALFAALAAAWKTGERLAALGACWCVGAYLPFFVGGELSGRISYLYYMVLVMPGVYLVTARFFAMRRMPAAATLGWAVALIYGFVHLYPIRTLL
jgi:hypothetical protein